MTDWREAFPDDSRVSWERRLAAEAGADMWAIARPFAEAWRRDSTSELARRLENHVAVTAGIALEHGFPDVAPLDDIEQSAVLAAMSATRRALLAGGVDEVQLYRGQASEPAWARGHRVRLDRRALTAWTPERAIAVGHAGRNRPAAVLSVATSVDRIGLAFDPSSDGEIVLVGPVTAIVDTLVS